MQEFAKLVEAAMLLETNGISTATRTPRDPSNLRFPPAYLDAQQPPLSLDELAQAADLARKMFENLRDNLAPIQAYPHKRIVTKGTNYGEEWVLLQFGPTLSNDLISPIYGMSPLGHRAIGIITSEREVQLQWSNPNTIGPDKLSGKYPARDFLANPVSLLVPPLARALNATLNRGNSGR